MAHLQLPQADNDCAEGTATGGGAYALAALFEPYFAGLHSELAIAAGFDTRGRLLSFFGASGTSDSNPALIPLVRAALRPAKVTAIIIAHNHPDGDLRASASDIASTRRVAALCRLAGTELADHFLFTDHGVASFREMGLI
jgi:DNA repair protein RadC